ncbi:hypothetical protein Tco_0777096 [Tanacetum coccineum]
MMNIDVRREESSTQTLPLLTILVTVIPKTSTAAAKTIPSTIPTITPLPQQSTPTLVPTTEPTTTSIPSLLDFSSLFGFDQRVFALEKELSQFKQVEHSTQLLATIKSQIHTMVDAQLRTRLGDYIQEAFRSYTTEFEKKAQAERKRYIDLVESSVKNIIHDEVRNKMQKIKSYRGAPEHRELYDELVKSYKLDKDLFEYDGKAYSLKRDHEDKDKDEDPPAGSDQRYKKRKTNKDAEPSKGSQSKESKSSSFKGTKSQLKSSGNDLGNTDDQANVETASRPNCKIAQAEKPPLTFDELMSNPIDFSAYVMNNLKIDNLTQEQLVGPAFNILKGTCRSRVELEYHFEECYKAVSDRLDWNNPEGQEYPFDLSKPLPLIEDRGRQVDPVNYFINNDLEYLKGGSLSRKYMTSTTKTKAAKYDNKQGIKDMVLTSTSNKVSKHHVYSNKRIIAITHVKVMKWYDYGYLEEIEVRREDQKFYKFKECDFLRLNLRDIEDMLLLLHVEDLQLGVKSYQKKLNITRPETFKLMRSDELYKFCDEALTSVSTVLHDIASNLRIDYLPKRRWSNLDIKWSRIMIKVIDKQLFERRLIRNLEKFVGGRDYGEDLRLLERTI